MRKPTTIAIVIALVGASMLILAGYWFQWAWTGFFNKTLWDWLQLLIIPAALTIGGFGFSQVQKGNEQRITDDNQQEAALQAYIDKMSELLLEKQLRESSPDAEVRKIARVRTLTVLQRLKNLRKGSVIQFLYESGLISKDKYIIDLEGATLHKADLSGATLTEIDLSGAILTEADLSGVDLNKADLSRADLSGTTLLAASLSGANLHEANLSRATLIKAKLNGANLSEADLSEATLIRVKLNGANMSGAILWKTNLSEADLTKADVTSEQLYEAKSLQGATMPDGSLQP